ncbi:MAG: hypothetical protein V5A72_00435 [Candidatus Nanohaloarchaea archaeon]
MADKVSADKFLESEPEKMSAEDFLSEEPSQEQPIETVEGSLLGDESMKEMSGASFSEPMTRDQVSREVETPEFLRSENIPTGSDLWKSITSTPEVADRLIVGAVSFFPSVGAKMTRTGAGQFLEESPEESMEAGQEWAEETHKFVQRALHFGMDTGEPSDRAKPTMKMVQEGFQVPREWLFEPTGKAYEKLTGSKIGGALTADAMEVLFYTAAMPKMREAGGKIGKRVKKARRAKERARAREEATKESSKTIRQVEEVEARERADVSEAAKEARDVRRTKESLEELEAIEREGVRREIERQERLDDAEAIRQREYEARQKVYDDFFTDERVKEFLDDVESFVDRKARGEGPKVTKEEIDVLYDNFVERTKNRDEVFRKDWRNWQSEKLRLDAEGIKPQADLFRGLQFEIGPEGKGLPPAYSDLKFGVEAQRPYPPKGQMEPFIKVADQYTPQKQKLGYKGDYSLRRKMRPTGKNKAPTKEEFHAAQETRIPKAERQGTALMEMGENIFRDLEGRGVDTSRSFSEVPPEIARSDYVPPANNQALEMSQAKLQAREQTIRNVVERKKEAAKSDELNRLIKEQEKERLESADPAEPETLSFEEIRQMDDMHNHFSETPEPKYESPFRESLREDAPRPLTEMLDDWQLAMKEGWRNERGSISFEKLSEQQQAAIQRINKDIQVIKRNAQKTMKSVSQYLLDAGFTRDVQIAKYIEENAQEVVKDEHMSRVPVSSKNGDGYKVQKMHENARKAKREKKRNLKQKVQEEVGRRGWAQDPQVRSLLENDPSYLASAALNAKINVKGSSAWADMYFRDAQKQIYGHLSNKERELVDSLIDARTQVDIAERRGGKTTRKTPEDVKAEDNAHYLENFERIEGLSDAEGRMLRQSAEDYFNVMNDLLRVKYEEGAIPKWLYDMLSENRYSPIRYNEISELGNVLNSKSGQLDVRKPPRTLEELEKFTKEQVSKDELDIKSTEIKRLSGGKNRYYEMNKEELLASMVAETWNWVMKNHATRRLGEWAESVDNSNVRPAEIHKEWVGKSGEVHRTYKPAPEGMKELHFFRNGERETIYAADWFANEWATSNPELSNFMGGLVRTVSGSGVLRAFATGPLAPLFALKGHAMDVLTILTAAQKRMADGTYQSVYSTNPVKALPQLYTDMARVMPDVIMKRGRYREAARDGLLMNWLAEGGQPTFSRLKAKRGALGAAETGLRGTWDGLSYLNRNSEIAARLAVRERMLREGYSREAATATARDYLDYSQGGSVVKAIDNLIPFFNVAVQSARVQARAIKRNKKQQASKYAQLAGIASAIYAIGKMRDPKAYEQSSDYIKNNYFMFPTGWKVKDDLGNEHRVSFKIRKEPAVSPFFTAGELVTAAAMGDEVDYNRAWKSLFQPLPRVDISAVPFASAAIAYMTNTDPYTLSRIWRGEKVEPESEWNREKSSRFWKDFGDVTGLSPERMRAAYEQVAGSGGFIQDAMGRGYDYLRDNLDEESHELTASDMVLNNWGKEFLHVTSDSGRFWDMAEDIPREEASRRSFQNRKFDSLAKEYYIKENIGFDKINEELRKLPEEDRKRIEGRLENFAYTQDLPERNIWMHIGSIGTADRKAKAVHNWMTKYSDNPQEFKKSLIYLQYSPSRIIPESTDSKFWKNLQEEMGGEGPTEK